MALLHEQIEGKYEILEKLKEGGMGAIYKVRHRLLDEVRVVKVIRSHMEPTGEAGERFLREARVANRLRHPNIAALHDFAIGDDGNAFIVMEFIDGLNLLEILQTHGPPPISLTLEIARQSLKALGYLHRHRLVHRDVSPDNLMLTRDVDGQPQMKLIDLGIAKGFEGGAAGGLTTTGIFLGKPRYASPEQFGTAPLDARSDVYSFGVVLYELLVDQCPISGKDPASFMAGHLIRPPLSFDETDPRGRIPAHLREAVMRALAKKPEERFPSTEDFIWALTLIQDRFPLTGQELSEVFAAGLPAMTRPLPLPKPGSTQNKLDREFLMTQTPAPTSRTRTPEEPTPHPPYPPLPSHSRPSGRGGNLQGWERGGAPLPGEGSAMGEGTGVRSLDLDDTLPLTSGRAKKEGSLLDATWLTVPRPAKVEPAELPLGEPLPQGRAASTSGSSWKWIAVAAVLIVGVGAGGLWWRSRSAPAPVQPARLQAPLPGTVPASVPAGAPKTVPIPEVAVPEPSPSSSLEAPAAAPSPPPPTKPREVDPEDAVSAAEPVTPMRLGDMIRKGLPNVQEPEVKAIPAYAYPAAAKGSGRKPVIRVRLLVDENGRVIEAKIREGDDSGLGFNEAALEAARKTSFFPATRDDIAGRMWTELIFEFLP